MAFLVATANNRQLPAGGVAVVGISLAELDYTILGLFRKREQRRASLTFP
jgi:hypothetical protein